MLQSSKMEPALSIIQVGKNDEREYLPEYKIFVAIYLYTQILPTDFFTFP